jgi:tRNA(adenine34) deaminase
MQAFTAAANTIGGKYLTNCTLYVTLEPCIMCAGAAYWTQISRVVYGAPDAKRGFSVLGIRDSLAANNGANINVSLPFHPKTVIECGVLANECSNLVREFFKSKRE